MSPTSHQFLVIKHVYCQHYYGKTTAAGSFLLLPLQQTFVFVFMACVCQCYGQSVCVLFAMGVMTPSLIHLLIQRGFSVCILQCPLFKKNSYWLHNSLERTAGAKQANKLTVHFY